MRAVCGQKASSDRGTKVWNRIGNDLKKVLYIYSILSKINIYMLYSIYSILSTMGSIINIYFLMTWTLLHDP